MKKTLFLPLFPLLCLLLAVPALAGEADCQDASFSAEGFPNPQRLWDGDRGTYSAAGEGAEVRVSRDGPIAGLYMEFDRLPQPYELEGGGKSVRRGEEGFLHEYVDVSALLGAVEELTLRFPAGTVVADIYAFSAGDLPGWVQVWEPPCEEADLLLFSSHSDDEQLFFAGILPYYAIERQLSVQVAYIVQHFEANGVQDHRRPHEQLDGLWAVGVRHYPIISPFPDLYSESKDRAVALSRAIGVYEGAGYGYEDFVDYITACIRRCKPLVVVSHDLNGEYGHGTHVLCADALCAAVGSAADPSQFPGSAGEYGVWQVEKTYLHLYDENPIVLNLDTPLDSLGGKTPFQVTQEGFQYHKSQHWTWFYQWLYGTAAAPVTRAADITRYSPCLYGLYDTQVGPDTEADFFDHVKTYPQRRAEEEARLEAERAEEERRAQEARLAAEEAERAAEEARLAAEAQARRTGVLAAAAAAAAAVVAAAVILSLRRREQVGRNRKGRREP